MSSAAQPAFAKVPSQVSLPAIEEGILELWTRLDAFQESNRRRQAQGAPEFVFYDGPPFATGTPHYGHLLAGTIKDIIPRFWTMRGHQVDRRFGWDCHGLPIENLAQKALNLNGTPEIRALGVGPFNEQCRSMVLQYVNEWRRTVTRMGRWVDFDRDYKTMDRDFMESVWWVFKRLWDQGRIYKAHRIMPYSWKLTTPLSNFEAGNNYKDVQDPAVTVRFRLRPEVRKSASPEVDAAIAAGTAYVLAWTTTPWTLPSNLALCVGPDIAYQWIADAGTGDSYLIAKDRVTAFYKKPEQFRVLAEVAGKTLVGLTYEPLFPYLAGRQGAFRIVADGFVTTGDGTGIVHMAPAYGEDDYRVARAQAIITPPATIRFNVADLKAAMAGKPTAAPALDLGDLLDEEARFTATVPEYAGQFCKDADKAIIKRLKDEGKLVHQSTLVHSYPFCERTDTPLIYRAIEAWYVRVEDLRERMSANNAEIRWVPEAVGANRFGNWLKEAKDWNISRNRFWGSCLPVWISTTDPTDMLCFGSVAELEAAAGLAAGAVTDLHKHHLDQLVITRDGKTYKRTPEVLDCWFESGAMPYAQVHWMGGADGTQAPPVFPAQFIAEGLDQTRGWFYTLLVLSTALFDKPAFRNVVVNGLILAEAHYKKDEFVPNEFVEERQGRPVDKRDGTELRTVAEKMSKSKKNYPDPHVVLDTYGADALRAYLIDSPVVRAEPLKFSEAGLKEIVRSVVLPYWNALSFFTTYAAVDGFDPRSWSPRPVADRRPMDRWVVSVLQSLVKDVNAEMEGYRLYNVVPRLVSFIDQLTNTYIRLNRARFWKSSDRLDQADAYHTLYGVLATFAKVLAPFMPFLTEEVHQRLVRPVDATAPASVHWCDYPTADPALIDLALEADVAVALTVAGLGRKLREDHKLKVRQPLPAITVVSREPAVRAAVERFQGAIAQELNVKAVRVDADEAAFCTIAVKPNLKVLGKRCGPKLKPITAALAAWSFAEVAEVEAGRAITVEGEAIGAGDLLLARSPRGGAIVASAGAVTVALDTAVTPALAREGHARELISVLQQARKAAGLEVADRIAVEWDSADGELQDAFAEHAALIADEVLATAFTRSAGLAGTVEELNGKAVRYRLAKA